MRYPDHFWDKVDCSGDCWVWIGSRNKSGYAQIKVEGKLWLVHRFIYTLLHGEIPDGMVIMHSCDNPSCIRPDHLSLGTQKDNIKDCNDKGRWNAARKLSSIQVAQIRSRLAAGERNKDLALEYKVSEKHIIDIKYNRTWIQ